MLRTLCILIFILVCISCNKASTNRRAHNTQVPQIITLAYTDQQQCTLIHIAMAKGYFSDENLQIRPLVHAFGKRALQSLLNNEADFATAADVPIMFSLLKNEKFSIVANMEAGGNNGIVARKDSGIVTFANLKGKRIGFIPGTASEFFLDSILMANTLVREEIIPIPLNPEDIRNAILTKKIDALSIWNSLLSQINQELGANGKIFYDREIYTETFDIIARPQFIQAHPEAVTQLLRALIKAENFIIQNPEEAKVIISLATKTDKKVLHELWNKFNYQLTLDNVLLVTLQNEARWAINKKLTKATVIPDFLDFIYLDALKAVKPEAVRLKQ